jgi:murein DD-endopeptidase MepM/ murein hydrolase activator NlpD
MVTSVCPRCARVVDLHAGRPFVSAGGAIELWHVDCWERRDEPLDIRNESTDSSIGAPIVAPLPPPQRSRSLALAGGAGAVLAAFVLIQHASAEIPAAAVHVELVCGERPTLRAASTEFEVVPPDPRDVEQLAAQHPVPSHREELPLDEACASLHGWVHPVAGTRELFPAGPGRHFGAEREGIERAECGRGHCGVDLDGPRGRAIITVAPGVVTRVERREDGGDGISGRFVKVQHDDGAITSYMHLDTIDGRLELGDRVEQGQYLGTLGSTGVSRSVPHLHFSLELPRRRTLRGDLHPTATRFVDPAPFLIRARMIDSPLRVHPKKPAT